MYVSHLVEIFREVRRALRKDGTFWLNLGDSYSGYHGNSRVPDSEAPSNKPGYIENMRKSTVGVSGLKQKDLIGIPWMTAFALRADGWYLRQDIVWAKKNCLPESMTDRCTKSHEYLFLLSKSARYYFDNEAIKEPASGREPGNKTHKHVDSVKRRVAEGDHSERTKLGLATTGAFSFRNKRDVWTTSTRPYKGAHFAVFPTALVEPPILAGTSEKGCCKKCGSPWKRVMERGLDPTAIPLSERPESGRTQPGNATVKPGSMGPGCKSRTVGWKPTCDCNAGDPVPCTVLDPFGGSGTTGEVAERLGRNSILIELNPSYVELAKRRTIKRVPVLPGDSWKEPVTRV
jgi:DNA modification methylase